ncbi:hypothetical protein P8605_14205 [Streptomyces sp. T-3]|nr:hypothetical protein [Streptomyces sp. T-3]
MNHTSRARTLLTAAVGALALALCAPTAHADDEFAGHSFNTAAPITPGATVRQDLVVGDMLLWRVDLEPGQKLAVEARARIPAGYGKGGGLEAFGIAIYSPVRQELYCGNDQNTALHSSVLRETKNGGTLAVDCSVGDPADARDKPLDLGGSYYVQAALGKVHASRGTVIPLEIAFTAGEGITPPTTKPFDPGRPKGAVPEATAQPTSKGAAPSDASAGAAQHQAAKRDVVFGWVWLAAATLAIAVLARWIVRMRRRRAPRREYASSLPPTMVDELTVHTRREDPPPHPRMPPVPVIPPQRSGGPRAAAWNPPDGWAGAFGDTGEESASDHRGR